MRSQVKGYTVLKVVYYEIALTINKSINLQKNNVKYNAGCVFG